MKAYQAEKYMRVNKSQSLLFIFETLLTKGSITKQEITNQLEISDLSFKRYIQELRAYIYNFSKDYELIYDRSLDKYLLKNK